jgi:hypothetical protein
MRGKVIFLVSCAVILVSGLLLILGGPGKPDPIVPDGSVQTEVEVEEGEVLVRNLNGPEQVVSAERVAEASPGEPSQVAKDEVPKPEAGEGTADEPHSPGYTGEIAGRVVHTGGKPVAGCEVVASRDHPGGKPEFFERGWYPVDEPFAITDTSGEFRISGLPRGSYVVSFYAHGHVAKAEDYYLGRLLRGTGQRQRKIWIDQTLEPAGVIFGRVVENLTGEPIEGAKVAAAISPERMPFHRESVSWHAWHDCVAVFTEADGRFRLDVLYPNEIYDLVAEGSRHHAVKKESVPVDSGESVEFVLSSGGVMEGIVSSAVPGVGADGAEVIASIEGAPVDDFPPWYKSVVSATDGRFRLDGLPAGNYEIDAWKDPFPRTADFYLAREPKKLALGFGNRITGIDLVLDRLPTVSGRVIDKVTREGIPGVVLQAGRQTVTTDDTGKFTLAMLPSARLFPGIRVIDFKEIPKAYGPAQFVNIDVGEEDIEDLIIELTPGGTVRGKVVLPNGIPVDYPNVSIGVADSGRMQAERQHWAQNTKPRTEGYEDGSFEISGIPPGFEVVVTGRFDEESGDARIGTYGPEDYFDWNERTYKYPEPHWRTVAKPEEYGVVRSEPFTLAAGEVKEGMVLTVRPLGKISGTIRDEKGEPATDGYAVQVSSHIDTKPDTRGFYAVGGLRPGKTRVTLWEEHEEGSIPIETKTITVVPGEETTGVDFVIPDRGPGKPEGYIAGAVVDGKGEPFVGTKVTASWYDEEGERRLIHRHGTAGETITDQEGRFSIGPLFGGTYSISASDYFGPGRRYGGLAPVQCPSENVTIVMKETGSIRGRVVRAGSGEPVRRFELGRSLDSSGTGKKTVLYYDHASPNGVFDLDELAPGPVEIHVRAEGIGSATRTVELGSGEAITDLLIELGDE